MPSWPTQSDYKDSLQNPDTAFRDPDLKASAAERSPMGVPRARSGAFAQRVQDDRAARRRRAQAVQLPQRRPRPPL